MAESEKVFLRDKEFQILSSGCEAYSQWDHTVWLCTWTCSYSIDLFHLFLLKDLWLHYYSSWSCRRSRQIVQFNYRPCWKSWPRFLSHSYPTALAILKIEYHFQKLMNSQPEVEIDPNWKLSMLLVDFIVTYSKGYHQWKP